MFLTPKKIHMSKATFQMLAVAGLLQGDTHWLVCNCAEQIDDHIGGNDHIGGAEQWENVTV